MKLNELKEAVDHAVKECERQHCDPESVTVYIPTFKVGTVGHIPCTAVRSARMGFDWESHSFLVQPLDTLREIDRDEINTIRKKYDELGWSHYKVSKIKKENEQLKQQVQQLKAEAAQARADAESFQEAARQATGYVQR